MILNTDDDDPITHVFDGSTNSSVFLCVNIHWQYVRDRWDLYMFDWIVYTSHTLTHYPMVDDGWSNISRIILATTTAGNYWQWHDGMFAHGLGVVQSWLNKLTPRWCLPTWYAKIRVGSHQFCPFTYISYPRVCTPHTHTHSYIQTTIDHITHNVPYPGPSDPYTCKRAAALGRQKRWVPQNLFFF